jgi:hypothetical protein
VQLQLLCESRWEVGEVGLTVGLDGMEHAGDGACSHRMIVSLDSPSCFYQIPLLDKYVFWYQGWECPCC